MGRTQARMLGPALAAADFDRAARLAPGRTDYSWTTTPTPCA